jgi:hypothetical protein
VRYGLVERNSDGSETIRTLAYKVRDDQTQPFAGEVLYFEQAGQITVMQVLEMVERPELADLPVLIVKRL